VEAAAGDAVIALVGSAGGLAALLTILSVLPRAFPAAILVVQHLPPRHPSSLVAILGWHSSQPVAWATEGGRLVPGTVCVAPPDRHLLLTGTGLLTLSAAPPVRSLRPAADPLLASLAAYARERAIGVILSGTANRGRADGTDGARAIKEAGGRVVAQDATTSGHFGMPGAAIASGWVDRVLPVREIGPALLDMLG
jgi:two-component system chemotaxis response regulator CheB